MNTDHGKFQADLELLCSLPPSPHKVPLEDLREDMDLDTVAQVRTLLGSLRSRGFVVVTRGDMVGLGAANPEKAEASARRYWRRMGYPT